MIRAHSIQPMYLRDDNGTIVRHSNGKAVQDMDSAGIKGFPLYVFKFGCAYKLDCHFEPNAPPVEKQCEHPEMVDEIFDTLVNEFAFELAKRMKYTNYKNLERHGINANAVLWDKKYK